MKWMKRILIAFFALSISLFALLFVLFFAYDITIDNAELWLDPEMPDTFQEQAAEYLREEGTWQSGFVFIHHLRHFKQSDDYIFVYEHLPRVMERFPEYKEDYISFIVMGILNEDTEVYAREHLFYLLERLTGEEYEYYKWEPRVETIIVDGVETEVESYFINDKPDDPDPEAIEKVREWWIERLREMGNPDIGLPAENL